VAIGVVALAGMAACTVAPAPDPAAGPGGPTSTVVVGPAVSVIRGPGDDPAPATTTTAPPTAAQGASAPVAGPAPVLRGDGLGIVSLGDDAEAALATLRRTFGPDDFDSGWSDGVRSLTFGLLYVELRDEGGARTLAGLYYTLPGTGSLTTTPVLDTARPLGLGRGRSVTFGEFTAWGTPAAPNPDHAGATCETAPGGKLCAYVDEPVVDDQGTNVDPAPTARLIAVVVGRIQPFGHCL
jgi:hypothetical protein